MIPFSPRFHPLRRALAGAVLCLLASGVAWAHPQWPGSRLQGEATLRVFGFGIYQAQLWTAPDFTPATLDEQPLLLELRYLRGFKGAAIAQRSLDEMRRAGEIDEAKATRWLSTMAQLFPDVAEGDRISGRQLPGQGAQFWHNGRLLGQVNDPVFAQRFFGIWLSPHTSQPGMRLQLLGQPG